MNILFSLPVQLVVVIIGVILFGTMVPLWLVEYAYTFSQFFKGLLGLVLPFMVFFFVLSGIRSFKKNAPQVLAILLSSIFISNGLAAFLSYGVMNLIAGHVGCQIYDMSTPPVVIEPIFNFNLALPFEAIHALIAALVLGIGCSIFNVSVFDSFAQKGKKAVEKILMRLFIPYLPLYVLGFLLKIRCEGLLACLIQQYGSTVLLIVTLQLIYLCITYYCALGFSIAKAWDAIKVAIPSYLTAFSTMSSTATVPVSVKSAVKNTGNKPLADMAMPILANVHLLGDSIATPILAMVTMLLFTGSLPGIAQYVGFVFYFCSTMFAVSGIPGGGILVMIPVLVSQLGFTPEMVSIVTTLYFLLDSFGTAANVMGDGALVILVNKILIRMKVV